MNKKQKILYVGILFLSPIILGSLYQINQPPESVFGLFTAIAVVIGWPIIAIIGGLTAYLTRNSQKKNLYFILGYLIPTLTVLGWQFGLLQELFS